MRKRKNSGQYAKQIMKLLCSGDESSIYSAGDLLITLYGEDFETWKHPYDTTDKTNVVIKVPSTKADKFIDWLLAYFKKENDLVIHRNDTYEKGFALVSLVCKKVIPAKLRKMMLKKHPGRVKNPRRRKNSGQYAKQVSELLCKGRKNPQSVDQAAEFILALYPGEQPIDTNMFDANIFYYFAKNKKKSAMAMYNWAATYFSSVTNILVMYEYLDLISQHVVSIRCSNNVRSDIKYYTGEDSVSGRLLSVGGKEYKSNPRRRKNSAYPKLEQLLCDPNTDTETLTQVAEMILTLVDFSDLLLPEDHTYEAIDIHGKVHEFYHEENPYVAQYAPSYGSFGVPVAGYSEIIFQLKEIKDLVYQNAFGSLAAYAIAKSIASMLPNTAVYLLDGVGPPTIYVYCPSPVPASQIRRRRSFSKMFYGGSFKRIQ